MGYTALAASRQYMVSRRRLRLLAVPLLLVLVPCAAIGVIGYQWLRLGQAQT